MCVCLINNRLSYAWNYFPGMASCTYLCGTGIFLGFKRFHRNYLINCSRQRNITMMHIILCGCALSCTPRFQAKMCTIRGKIQMHYRALSMRWRKLIELREHTQNIPKSAETFNSIQHSFRWWRYCRFHRVLFHLVSFTKHWKVLHCRSRHFNFTHKNISH